MCLSALYYCVRLCLAILYICLPALGCCGHLCLAILCLPALDAASSSFDFEKYKLFGVYGGVIPNSFHLSPRLGACSRVAGLSPTSLYVFPISFHLSPTSFQLSASSFHLSPKLGACGRVPGWLVSHFLSFVGCLWSGSRLACLPLPIICLPLLFICLTTWVLVVGFPAHFSPTSINLFATSFHLFPTSFRLSPSSFHLSPSSFHFCLPGWVLVSGSRLVCLPLPSFVSHFFSLVSQFFSLMVEFPAGLSPTSFHLFPTSFHLAPNFFICLRG